MMSIVWAAVLLPPWTSAEIELIKRMIPHRILTYDITERGLRTNHIPTRSMRTGPMICASTPKRMLLMIPMTPPIMRSHPPILTTLARE